MHYYLFDDRVNKHTTSTLNRVKSWIKTSRIAGQQLDLKSPQQIVEEVKKIASNQTTPTIVVIGDDLSLDLAISSLSESKKHITVGFIPMTTNSKSAQLLGITHWKQASNTLLRGKRENYKLLQLEDYTVLSGATLIPKSVRANSNTAITLSLDDQLKAELPLSEIMVANISNDPTLHEHNSPILIEAITSQVTEDRLQNKKPLITLPDSLKSSHKPKILRLKAESIAIQTATPFLLQGLIQLRPSFSITPLARQQSLIVSRKRDSLA